MGDDEVPIISSVDGSSRDDRHKAFSWSTAVELPILLVMFAISLSGAPITNIVMYRTCVHSLDYPKDKCRAFLRPGRTDETHDMEAAVQQYSTFVSTVKSVLESLLPAVLSLFMVVWSDKHGRKPLLVWPIFGITLTSMLLVAYSLMDNLGPWWYIATCVPYSLTGGFSIMGTASLCYVTDVTGEQKRSLRLIAVAATFTVGMAGGAMASSYLLRAVGAVYLLLIAAALLTAGYAYAVVCIEESIENTTPGTIWSVLDFSLVQELFRECFKSRQNRLRAQILLATVSNSLDTFTTYGLSDVTYLFTRKVLHWSLQDYTQYSAISTTICFVGSFLVVGVVQRIFPIGDLTFAILAFATLAAKNFIRTFAVTGWQMYLGSIIALFGTVSSSLTRSYLSKILPAEDIAKAFALMCAIEGLCPLIAPVLYNSLYAETLSVFPGAFMVMTAGINVVCFVLMGIVAYLKWADSRINYVVLHTET